GVVGGDALRQRLMHSHNHAVSARGLAGFCNSGLEPIPLFLPVDIGGGIAIDEINASLDPVVIISGKNKAFRLGGAILFVRGVDVCAGIVTILVLEALGFEGRRQEPMGKLLCELRSYDFRTDLAFLRRRSRLLVS